MNTEFPNPKRQRKARREVHRWTYIAVPFAGIALLGYLLGFSSQLGVVGTGAAVTLIILAATKILFGWPRLPRQRSRPRPATSAAASSQGDLVSSGTAID